MAVIAERMGYDHGLDKEAITKAQDVLREIFVELKNSTPSFAKGWHKPVHFEDVPVEKVDRFVEAIMKEPVDLKTAIDLSREIMADLDYPKYDDRIFESQIPGGMLSNLQNQLKGMGVPEEKFDEVMAEMRTAGRRVPHGAEPVAGP